MSAATGNKTLDRIQLEIQESVKREKELRFKYDPRPMQPPAPPASPRLFTQNGGARGLMQKFYQMRGRAAAPADRRWAAAPAPPAGPRGRNGFVSAQQKMERELNEFRTREEELRRERRKSQPDLMAALEEVQGALQPAASVSSLNNDEWESNSSRSSGSGRPMKRSQSLAALCDLSDEEADLPSTHSLIMQFERLNRV